MGNTVVETTAWDGVRLQPSSITAVSASATLLNLGYYFCASPATSCSSNSGNLLQQNIVGTGVSMTQTYAYDAFNRISAVGECNAANSLCSFDCSQTYGYDVLANRAVTVGYGAGTVNPVWTPTAVSQLTSKNQFLRDTEPSGADKYDLAGNQISVASTASPDVAANTMTYDAENRMATANIGGTGSVTYTYDGDGKRVMKSSSAGTTVYVYDGMGQLAAEYSTVALIDIGTLYLTADMLGSTRLVTNSFGSALKCYDYMPFGEDIANGVGPRGSCYASGTYPATPDVSSEKFTGKKRDAESGLDYFEARYLSAPEGRFLSADPGNAGADSGDPQSWNAYAYVGNNPLVNTDPDGMWACTGPDCNDRPADPSLGNDFFFWWWDTYSGTRGTVNHYSSPGRQAKKPISAPNNGEPPSPCLVANINAVNAVSNLNVNMSNVVGQPFIFNCGLDVNFSVPGASPSSLPAGRYPSSFLNSLFGIGSSLHVPAAGGADPSTYGISNGNFTFTTHIDTAYSTWHTPIGALIHLFTDVRDKGAHRGPC